ncbi:hypothetical protein [Clostridium tertium]|uniref:hypothetical protein n=1 Tax=Clostridium tertium TaxID=1559 RepID=UPI0023B347DB|nr:hypothetical protein [Clostridium tertium]
MKIITNIFEVCKDKSNEQEKGKMIFKVDDINLDDKENVVPQVATAFTNKNLMVASFEKKTYGNFSIKDNTIYIEDKLDIIKITEGEAKIIIANSFKESTISNLVELLDFLRVHEALLLTSNFPRKNHALTAEGEYTEIPALYTANFKNIRYSSKHVTVSIPYIVKGDLLNFMDQTDSIVDRIVSAVIVNENGQAVPEFSCIINKAALNELKEKVMEPEILEVDSMETYLQTTKDDNVTYLASKYVKDLYILRINTTKLVDYPIIKNGTLNLMCNPTVLHDSISRLNYTVRMIKAYKEGNVILKDALNRKGYDLEPEFNIYDIPPLENNIDSNPGALEIEFYIPSKKTIPSFRKMIDTYMSADELLNSVKEMIFTENFSRFKDIVKTVSNTLQLPENLDILNKDLIIGNLQVNSILDLIPYSAFLDSINITEDLYSKYIENKLIISELETQRELLKARISYARNCISKSNAIPVMPNNKIRIDIVDRGFKNRY